MYAGKTFKVAKSDVSASIDIIKYYAGWADKITGKVLEVCPVDLPPAGATVNPN
jgi:hypothetical protein